MNETSTQKGESCRRSPNGALPAVLATSFSILILTLSTAPCPGQGGLISPSIQNPSIMQGTNTRMMDMWVPTQAGVNYTAEFRSQTSGGAWSQFTNFPGSGFSDPIADNITGVQQRFYRLAADPRPWIRSQPHSRNPYSGETVQLDVTATGLLPLSYQWNGPSGPLSDGGRINGSGTPNLVIANVDPSDVGNYWVSITNLYGSTSCVPAGVRISLSQAPRILIDPQSQALLVGQSLSLWSTPSGAQLIYKWYGPPGLMVDDGRIGGSTTTNLTIADLQVIDDGAYYMVASNAFGMATSAVATVRVQLGQSPRISTDPQSQTVIAGDTVNLSVVATGTGTLNYEWHGPSGILSNGGKISGATTANLTISNFQSSEDGDYYVVVSNTFGTATSGTANVRSQ